MPTVPLPDRPNLEQLRNQAKDLLRSVRAEVPEALAEVSERHPVGLGSDGPRGFALSDARLVVARRYGFSSWTPLKRYVEAVERYSRYPADVAPDVGPEGSADEFLRFACLSYERDDHPDRRRRARQLLSERPEITRDDIFAAAAGADVDAVRRLLADDPAAARREGGPYRWTPLLYLAYARHDPDVSPRRGRGLGAAPAGRRRRRRRRLPLARAAQPVHRADRGVRRRRTGSGPSTPPPALARPGAAASRGGCRPQRRAGALQPHVRPGQRPPRGALRVRPRRRYRRTVAPAARRRHRRRPGRWSVVSCVGR